MPTATDAALMEAVYLSLDRLAKWYDSVSDHVTTLGGTLLWTRADAVGDTDYENNLTVRNTELLDEAMTVMPFLSKFLGKWLRAHKKWIVDAGLQNIDEVNLFGLNDYLVDRGARVHDNVNTLFHLHGRGRPFEQAIVYGDGDNVLAQFDIAADGTGTISNIVLTPLPDTIGDCLLKWNVTSGTFNPAAPLTPVFTFGSINTKTAAYTMSMAAGVSGDVFRKDTTTTAAVAVTGTDLDLASEDGNDNFKENIQALIWGSVGSSSEDFFGIVKIDSTNSGAPPPQDPGNLEIDATDGPPFRWAFDIGAEIQHIAHEVIALPANMGGDPQGASTIQIVAEPDRTPAF